MLPSAQHYGLGVIPWSPLHGGLLSGVLRKQADGSAARSLTGRAGDALEKNRSTIEAWESWCAARDEDPADVAIAWLLHQPAVTAPIIGPRTMHQLEGGLRALEISLDANALADLDICRSAPAPIKQYGENASFEAAQRVDQMLLI